MYMKLDLISVHASRNKPEEIRAFEVVFKDMKNSFYHVKSMPKPCVLCSQRCNCSVVIMVGLVILQLAIHFPDGRPKKTFPVQLSGQHVLRYDDQVLCDPDKRSLRSQKWQTLLKFYLYWLLINSYIKHGGNRTSVKVLLVTSPNPERPY